MMKYAVLLLAVLTAACAHYPVNPQLAKAEPGYGYRFATTNDGGTADDTFVIVTMSGGGTRAAALAFGVLQKLAATPIRGGQSDLLSSVDVVSSVSGGSFTASYYALHGREGFADFRKNFLDADIQGGLVKRAANPLNWPKLLSPHYSRIDLAADYYDEVLFKNATYASMRPKAPYTILNSTEMDIGSQFTWVQEQFDTICSDLSQVHVARAAAASSAFPGLLTPLTLRNYAGKCGYHPGTWVETAGNDYLTNPRRYHFRSQYLAIGDPGRGFLHLMDGGIADNIGLRGPAHAVVSNDTLQMDDTHPFNGFSVMRLVNARKIKRVVVIVVNAKTENQLSLDKSERTPNPVQVISTTSNTPMANYSFDTVALMQADLHQQSVDAKAARDAGITDFPEAEQFFIQVSFSAIEDPAVRKEFNTMGTNFHLPVSDIDKLIAISGTLLDQSPVFQKLVQALR
jgi:NTE family protein